MQITVLGHTRYIHIQTFGDPAAPVLFLLHGGPGGDFRGLLDLTALSDRYFVVAWDQRGAGLSERITDDEISPQGFVDELDALRAHFSPNAPVTLVGHSWGGEYACLYAQAYPERVKQMVLLEPGPLISGTDHATTASFEKTELRDWIDQLLSNGREEEADYLLDLSVGFPLSAPNCYVEPVTYPGAWRAGARVIRDMTSFFESYSYAPQGFTTEILVVATDCSSLGYSWQSANTLPLLPSARIVEITAANHTTIVARPETLTAIRGYLAQYQ